MFTDRLRLALFRPVDMAWLVFFRIGAGVLIAAEPMNAVLLGRPGDYLALPLRHFLYPGPVHWTEQGHPFAWHLMLRHKTSTARFRVRLANGREEVADLSRIIAPAQHNYADHPDNLLYVAQWRAADYRAQGRPVAAVFADSEVLLNGRPPAGGPGREFAAAPPQRMGRGVAGPGAGVARQAAQSCIPCASGAMPKRP